MDPPSEWQHCSQPETSRALLWGRTQQLFCFLSSHEGGEQRLPGAKRLPQLRERKRLDLGALGSSPCLIGGGETMTGF